MARRRTRARATRESSEPSFTWIPFPSAQTLFRMRLLASDAEDRLSEAMGQARPQVLERDRHKIARIEQAETAEELLGLTSLATGLADRAWYGRLRAFGPEIVPLIAERLKEVRDVEDRHTQSVVCEHLLSALGFYGDTGTEAAMTCFDALTDYGKSLACVVLGHLGKSSGATQPIADRLWGFYQSLKEEPDADQLFVGPLWGLVDLEDPRAADALYELLWAEYFFYESFAMAYKAGDARIVLPLVFASQYGGEEARESAAWALAGVANRIGRDALLAEIRHIGSDTGVSLARHQALTDLIFTSPLRGADEYFAVFYRGFAPDTISPDAVEAQMEVLDRMRSLVDEGEPPARATAPAGPRPGRNDPCWCGSGKKYKHCHWRQDRAGD